jgi:hypothetical protein
VERLIGTKQDVTAEYDGGVQGVDDPAI